MDSALFAEGDYPQSVPICISFHLKICTLKRYNGSKDEFRFVTYIMENSKYLQIMTISCNSDINKERKLEMFQKFTTCRTPCAQG